MRKRIHSILVYTLLFSKLLSEIIKREQSEDHSQQETYSVTKTKLSTNPEKSDHIQAQTSGEN